jgi:glycosyltransferase involved in cell wall biosynthesis
MVTEPKISIITACYNHGRFIHEQLESVFDQTFKDFEVIIVNDGSTDDTYDILQKITHEKVTIINIENHGPAYARNLAIENAKAPLIMNLDADDKISSDLLEKAYNLFCSDSEIGIVHCDAECFGAKTGKFDIGEYTLESMLYDNRIISQSFFRKNDWRIVGGYSGDLMYGLEDWDFWLSIIETGCTVIKIPEMLVHYRTYKNFEECRSGRRKNDRIRMLTSLVAVFQRHKKLYSNFPGTWQHFSKLEKKLQSENVLLRQIKNLCYKYLYMTYS